MDRSNVGVATGREADQPEGGSPTQGHAEQKAVAPSSVAEKLRQLRELRASLLADAQKRRVELEAEQATLLDMLATVESELSGLDAELATVGILAAVLPPHSAPATAKADDERILEYLRRHPNTWMSGRHILEGVGLIGQPSARLNAFVSRGIIETRGEYRSRMYRLPSQ